MPAQKLDEAEANLQAMTATEKAAKAQYDLVDDGSSKEDKAAAAAQVLRAQGAVTEVESYLSDAMVYSPVTGEISTVIAEQGELVGHRLSGGGDPRFAGYVGNFQHQGDPAPANPHGNPHDRLRTGARQGGGIHGDLHRLRQADFATWAATRTQGGFDIRTFTVKAKPVTCVEYMRPGMSVLVDWSRIE